MELRQALLELSHKQASLRQHLVPLLREAADDGKAPIGKPTLGQYWYSSQEALNAYLRDHPKAKKELHVLDPKLTPEYKEREKRHNDRNSLVDGMPKPTQGVMRLLKRHALMYYGEKQGHDILFDLHKHFEKWDKEKHPDQREVEKAIKEVGKKHDIEKWKVADFIRNVKDSWRKGFPSTH